MPASSPSPSIATVYGVLMNHPSEHEALGTSINEAPYKAVPNAPVLYIKPSNTFVSQKKAEKGITIPLSTANAQSISVKGDEDGLDMRPCVGLVFQTPYAQGSTRFKTQDFEVGFFLDITRPHNSFYRPPIKFNAMDQSLVLPAMTIGFDSWDELAKLEVHCSVNLLNQSTYNVQDFLRPPLALLKAVSEFIAFEAGDVLLLGCPAKGLRVKQAGDTVVVMTFDSLITTLVAKFLNVPPVGAANEEGKV